MTEPATAAVAIVFLGSLFAGFYLLARAVPPAVYRKVALGLALVPSLLWAGLGLASSQPGLVVLMALVLAIAVLALSRLAARVAGTVRK